MAFFEVEFPRAIAFQRTGGQMFLTDVISVESGFEYRNRKWANPRAEYSGAVMTGAKFAGSEQDFTDALRRFFILVGGMADPFRFYDDIDHKASGEALGSTDAQGNALPGGQFQLQITYALGGRTYVRKITKPITADVVDFEGNILANSVVLKNSLGSEVAGTVDHETGIVTSGGSPVTADFEYHIPVRFAIDKFEPQIKQSAPNHRLISWNSLSLIEVRPPNY